MEKTYTLRDFCKRRRITPDWLEGECGSLELDADKSRLPEDELVVGGDLVIKSKGKCSLPPVIRVGGDLTLIGHGITELPQCVEVQRTLELRNTNVRMFHEGCKVNELKAVNSFIERLPENLTLAGGATFENCPLLTLPDGLNSGYLMIKKCPLTSLPKRLIVLDVLNIDDSFIKEVPADSQIGTLSARRTPIETLPDNWGVKFDLLLDGSALKCLPKGLHVGGALDISKTAVRVVPDDCVVGEMYADVSCLEHLPDNWTVEGFLYLRFCQMLKRLPNRLHVGVCLSISGTSIKEIPEDCQLGSLRADDSKLVRLPNSFCVKQSLSAENRSMESLRIGLFGNSISVIHSDLEILPAGLELGGSLHLDNTKVSEIPNDLVVAEELHLENCPVKKIPKEVIAGEIFCDQTVVNEAYAFKMGVFDIHPNGRYVSYNNVVYRVIVTHEDYLMCATIGSGSVLFLVHDEEGRAGIASSLLVAKAKLIYEQRKLQDFNSFRHSALNTSLPLELLLYFMYCSVFSQQEIETFVDGLELVKETYTIGEFLQLTEGLRGYNDFKVQFTEC